MISEFMDHENKSEHEAARTINIAHNPVSLANPDLTPDPAPSP